MGRQGITHGLINLAELLFIGALLLSACAALTLIPLVRALALRHGFVDRPGERKIHSTEIAYGGGIAVALSAALALGAGIALAALWLPLKPNPEDLRGLPALAIGLGALGALLLGLIDDKYKLSPGIKLAVQFALAAGAVAGGVRVTAFVGDTLFMQAATVLWIVLVTNSLNLLDNMDGLCCGTVAIAAAVLGVVAMDNSQWNLTLALAALSGACLGFFRYNRAPASIFLGDAGSLFAGFLMACFTVMATYYHGTKASHLAIGIPLLILAIPLYDTCSVMLIRFREGRPLMRGDTSHFSHRLVDLGMSRRQAVATIHLACLAIGLPATVLAELSEARGLLIVGQAFLVLTLVALLERAGRLRAANRASAPEPVQDAARATRAIAARPAEHAEAVAPNGTPDAERH